ncbi:hypothetical protein [Coleofasciculus sp. H7-2]|uniref:hypothetical protein n=1 Tax=Coleofasciculus sp. H7-2 TaxID=3351545 RepID=UPI00366E73E8
MNWLTYKIVAESGITFTHFSRSTDLKEAQSEWERKFKQKAISIALDTDNNEIDLSELFEEE